jgi:poly(beta-D-mannuronate) lyase
MRKLVAVLFGVALITMTGVAHAGSKVPANVLDLTNWKLTVPVGAKGSTIAAEIKQPQLGSYSSSYFKLTPAGDGVVFEANAGGATTTGSKYPRSELREMTGGGKTKAAWSTSVGTHTMRLRAAITHLPAVKPQAVVAQVHDAVNDVVMIRLDGPNHLYVEHNGGNIGDLDAKYSLGRIFTAQIVAKNGRISVFYNGVKKVDKAIKSTGDYFKAGCYTQSNTTKGDKSTAYGETVIYQLTVTHS